jgi:hypothetical protein
MTPVPIKPITVFSGVSKRINPFFLNFLLFPIINDYTKKPEQNNVPVRVRNLQIYAHIYFVPGAQGVIKIL